MKITFKLTLIFLFLSLSSLIIAFYFLYNYAENLLKQQAFNHLESVASIQEERIESIIDNNFDELMLILSRTQLRLDLKRFIETSNKTYQTEMNRILVDADSSIRSFKNISILTLDGAIVASSDVQKIGNKHPDYGHFLMKQKEYAINFFLDYKGNLMLYLSGPLLLSDRLLGILVIESDAQDFTSMVKDYSGLGRTGDIVLARQNDEGNVIFLAPVRFDSTAALRKVISKNNNVPIVQTIVKKTKLLSEGIDYRGKPVLAVTRYITRTGWGLVVKMDKEEAFSPIYSLRKLLLVIISISLLVVITISIHVARSITKPILRLTNVTKKVMEGDLSLEIGPTTKDELGTLTQVFDQMTKNFINLNTQLEKKVEERTEELQQANEVLIKEIEEHKRSQEALKRSEDQYRVVINTVLTGICTAGHDETITFVNPAFIELSGYSGNKLIGMNLAQLLSHEAIDHYEKMTRLRKDGMHSIYESSLRRKDGTKLDIIISASPLIDVDGSFKGTLAVITDITDRKRAEKALEESIRRLQALFNNAQDAILLTDDNVHYIDANPSACAMVGYTRDELLKLSIFDITPIPNRDFALKLWKEFIAEGKQEGEYSLRRKDGTIVQVEYRAVANIVPGIHLFIKRDVSLRKRAEQELLKAEKLESLGILAGGIAHDFNNILMGILGNISLAKMDTKPGSELSARLIEAENAVMRAKDLTQRLLTFSKGWAPVKTLISMKDLLNDSTTFALRGSNVKCEFFIPDDLWLVEVDEGQINQVIHNIVINACHAMPEGGIIKVQAENSLVEGKQNFPLKSGKYVKVSIEDQGIGIPEEHLSKIFDPYFTTKEKGSGLGLATSYSIIKNHGGYIGVQSKVNNGSTFFFYLPTSEGKTVIKTTDEGKPFDGKGKILVMDDEKTIRDILDVMLRRSGYEVSLAKDGFEAIKAYKHAQETSSPFNVIIMDLTIPGGMGGKEAIVQLRKIDPDVKVIVSSGYSSDPIISEFRNYGFTDVITKPYRMAELNKILQRVMMVKSE